ncbi:helical backbone metal receptor [Streptomyces marispadix]|uniref:Helical backbone metal receptor n=1 Tax=Streptomyces marispadix TaxID=2922868 RepID=A0ABS9SSN2_9ACTN|nr:helical backbone metal receptor [Streptomyces marispadix]MCH6159287.1 helical backbone metal receptor [Streptomyces marispadix]
MAHSSTGTVRRVVSLVPSLTEALAATEPELLAGATDWCSHPPGLDVARVRGTKNPDVERVVSLAPDLVVANEEENREADLAALRAAGLDVLVTEVRTLEQAFAELDRMLTSGCGLARPAWLDEAEAAWRGARAEFDVRAVIPVWRRPWMVLGRDTFAGALLAHLGVHNVYGRHAERYPRVPIDELNRRGLADLVVLPDEPYRFTGVDGPEAFPELPSALVDGRSLTWYGPSLIEAPKALTAALGSALSRPRVPYAP